MRVNLCLSACFVLMAVVPLYPQNKDIQRLQLDVITLQQQAKQLQSTVDANESAIKTLVEKLTDQVATGLQKTNGTLDEQKSDVRTIVTTLTALTRTLSDLQEELSTVKAQIASLSQQMTAMKTTAEPLAGPNDLWRSAQVDYLTGNYDLAIMDYQDFLSKYPGDSRAAEAHLRMGDSLMYLKKYAPAEAEFDVVLQNYPDSDTKKVALLRKGYVVAERDKPQAIKILNDVVKQFPNTSEAASAQEKLRNLTPRPAR